MAHSRSKSKMRRNSYDPHRHLAAAVLLRAMRDYCALTGLLRMRTADLEELNGRDTQGPKPLSTAKRRRLIAEVTDFLTHDSQFHQLAEVNPEFLAGVLGKPGNMKRFLGRMPR